MHSSQHRCQCSKQAITGQLQAGQLHGINTHLNAAPASSNAAPLAALKAARRPEAFDGRRRNLHAQMWLNSLITFISSVPEQHKLSVAATYLTGRAQEWLNCTQLQLTNFATFSNAFLQRFVDSTLREDRSSTKIVTTQADKQCTRIQCII